MKFVRAASPAVLLAGVVLAASASAQTWSQTYPTSPTMQPYAGQAVGPYAGTTTSQPYAGAAATTAMTPDTSTSLTSQANPPQGPYLQECREVRMLEGTLTAFCPKGDGTWRTTQLIGADRCAGNVRNAGGDLVCAMAPQVGSTAPPQGYVTSAGGPYAGPAAAPPYPPALPAPVPPAPAYAAPGYPSIPNQDFYTSPSAGRTAQPWGY